MYILYVINHKYLQGITNNKDKLFGDDDTPIKTDYHNLIA